MIELYVMGIALDTRTGTPIVVLNDQENRRALPIWIGTAEASAIIRQLEDIKSSRPMTHDLLYNMIETLGYKIDKIEINEINSDTYYANIFISDAAGKSHIIDARPSDAIALSLKSKSPIFATPNVIADGTISTDQERDEEEAEEFRDFIENLKASDFKGKVDLDTDPNQDN
ncbi:MAG: bifunctional nuclease family protein [Vampirovibrionales bacterium]|nr:bifunctional nuclease family protein [Vampirovibrionales bacterium]